MARYQGTKMPNGEWLPRVIVKIALVRPGLDPAGFTCDAVIDSGAQNTYLPGQVLEQLSVNYSELAYGGPLAGGGGETEYRLLEGRIKFEDVVFVDDVVRIMEPGPTPHVILGLNDFFRSFTVEFDWRRTPPIFVTTAVHKP